MAIIGIALLGFLLLAIIGKQAAQALLKGICVVIGLIVAYLVIGSQIISVQHAPVAPPRVLTPEHLTPYDGSADWWIALIVVGVIALCLTIAIAAGRSVAIPSTEPYGCAVGYGAT